MKRPPMPSQVRPSLGPGPPVPQQRAPQQRQHQGPPPLPPPQGGRGPPVFGSKPPGSVQHQHQHQQRGLGGAPEAQAPTQASKPLHPSANTSAANKASSRINPAQMPRPKQDAKARALQVFETRNYNSNKDGSGAGAMGMGMGGPDPYEDRLMRGNILSSSASIPPPPTSSRFVVKDLGNASPRFMRSTFYQVPLSKDVRRTCEMPFAILCQPLAAGDPLDTNQGKVMLVDASQEGPVRCTTCKAYMNPFVRWLDGGRRFQCNLCGSMNECPPWYFCNLGPNGTRRDQFDRPELQFGSVEYTASSQYLVRPPQRPACVFLIDCSVEAVNAGITHRICEAILRNFENRGAAEEDQGARVAPGKVGIATFGRTIEYISMKPGSAQPQITVVPDVDTPYAPVANSVLLDGESNREEICAILRFVMSMHSASNDRKGGFVPQESCAAAAIHSSGKVIQKVGGKVIAFVASLTNLGQGAEPSEADQRRKEGGKGGTLVNMIWPKGDLYTRVAEELAEKQVCVDVFCFGRTSTSHLDIARLRLFPEITGGSFVGYQDFDGSNGRNADAKRLSHDLRYNLTREQGFEALLRVRASAGLEVEEYRGSFLVRTPTDVDMAGIDADKSIVAFIKHEERLKEGQECSFQCALLYTTSFGERRIRVHTISLPTTSVLGSVYRSADLDAQMHAILRQEVHRFPLKKMQPQQVREAATAQCVNILYAYRKYCATASSTGQLILPEALKLMPLYMLAFNKLKSLQQKCEPDARASLVAKISAIPMTDLLPMLFPRLVALHKLADLPPDHEGDVNPDLLSCSSEAMDDDACLLLLEEDVGYIWIGLGVYPPVLDRLFGETTFEMIQRKLNTNLVGFSKGDLGGLCFKVVSSMCPGKCMRLKFVARGSMAETKMLAKLVEDRTQNGMSYVEYLCHIHRKIQNKFL
ncbi:Sec24-like protein transport protein [Chloropicon primus]|uniref:Sec24-like protein transport protein n=2 Tax=Chloropicon primus TaxID=1764295 RepID=A0A5B8MRX3_9CHLO|nr:Sec24-like protein transport protein [Chloropicon primus]UPR02430.1 Sec24-like protein transport protein [Chloropicon primus]|eukprot:QDZ23216.1 Sec24-like protein transport protein [Chloropicon primus]